MGSVVVAVAALHWLGRPLVGNVLAGFGVAGVVAAWVWPRTVRRLEGWVSRGVGGLLAWSLLMPFFYLVITPFGLLFRRGARDRLGRGVDPAVPTYWRDRDRQPSLEEPY